MHIQSTCRCSWDCKWSCNHSCRCYIPTLGEALTIFFTHEDPQSRGSQRVLPHQADRISFNALISACEKCPDVDGLGTLVACWCRVDADIDDTENNFQKCSSIYTIFNIIIYCNIYIYMPYANGIIPLATSWRLSPWGRPCGPSLCNSWKISSWWEETLVWVLFTIEGLSLMTLCIHIYLSIIVYIYIYMKLGINPIEKSTYIIAMDSLFVKCPCSSADSTIFHGCWWNCFKFVGLGFTCVDWHNESWIYRKLGTWVKCTSFLLRSLWSLVLQLVLVFDPTPRMMVWTHLYKLLLDATWF